MYEALRNKKAQRLKLIEKKEPEKQVPWWAQLFVNLGFGILSSFIEIIATTLLGPVGGMIVGVVADIGTNIVADLVNGQDPFSPENIIFNVVLPAANVTSRVKGIRRTNKNKMMMIGEVADNKMYKELAKELQEMGTAPFENPDVFERKYQNVLKKYKGLKLDIDVNDELMDLADIQKARKSKLDLVNTNIRKVTNVIRLIDPTYTTQKLSEFAFKPVKKYINNKLSRYFKKINTKFFKRTQKSVKNLLIPLNHLDAPWIKGVKLLPVRNTLNYFNVLIFFDKRITRKKAPVYIYNQKWTDIKPFLDAPSSGQYYINNIAWGWEIGKAIRMNKKGLVYMKSLINFFPQANKIINSSLQLVKQVSKTIDMLLDKEAYLEKWKEAPLSVLQGATSGIKGLGVVKPIIRTIQEKDNKYLIRYSARKASSFFNKKIKAYAPIAKQIQPYYERRNKK